MKRQRLIASVLSCIALLSSNSVFATSYLSSSSNAPTSTQSQQPQPENGDNAFVQYRSMESDLTFDQLPLSTHIGTSINSIIARTSIKQQFTNNTSEWLEGIYHFPLPEDAAVDSLLMHIGDRIIVGEIQEKAQAERTYQQAKKEGKRATIVRQLRPNLFTSKLANIAPGESISIEVQFQHKVLVTGTDFSLRMPLGITPRYNPSTSSITTEESQQRAPAQANQLPTALEAFNHTDVDRPVSIDIVLNSGFDLASLSSSSHEIKTTQTQNGHAISLVNPGQTNQDFVLNWKPHLGQAPSTYLFSERHDDYNYHLMMIMPPTHNYAQQSSLPREMIFVIDSSGSMSGESMQQAKAGMIYALQSLNPKDSFNVIDFDHEARALFPQAVPAEQGALIKAAQFISELEADGGTEIAKAVDMALTKPNSESLRQIIFLTDGSIGNEQEVFSLIHNKLGNNRLFTIGIGSAPNSFFMNKAAEFGRGTFTYINRVDQVQSTLQQLFNQLRHPVLSNLSIDGVDSKNIDLQPTHLRDLYLGEPLFASYRVPHTYTPDMTLKAESEGYQWSYQLPKVVNGNDVGVAKYWARMNIDSLTNERVIKPQEQASIRQRILDVALEFGLVSDYTSLVAVDKTPARVHEELRQLQLKNKLAKGWSNAKAHGHPQGGTASNLLMFLALLFLGLAIAHHNIRRKQRAASSRLGEFLP